MADPLKFYRDQLVPFWERHSKIKSQCAEDAEKIFWDILKLIITLSTGMMAFLVAVSGGIEFKYLIKFIILLSSAIILAILSFANSALKYKQEADSEGDLLHKLAKLYTYGNISEAEQLIKERESKPLEEGYNDWHILTIVLGILSLICFFIGTIWFIVALLTTLSH